MTLAKNACGCKKFVEIRENRRMKIVNLYRRNDALLQYLAKTTRLWF